jgi:hypothetical protein
MAGPPAPERAPRTYTPPHLAEKILGARPALEGERKQVTVLFAGLKDSTELIRGLDPEAAQQLLDPAIHRMMDAVHCFEGTVNQVLGDGTMALFGASIAHEDHALRACYAALSMQAAMRSYTEDLGRTQGLELRMRVGLNSGGPPFSTPVYVAGWLDVTAIDAARTSIPAGIRPWIGSLRPGTNGRNRRRWISIIIWEATCDYRPLTSGQR